LVYQGNVIDDDVRLPALAWYIGIVFIVRVVPTTQFHLTTLYKLDRVCVGDQDVGEQFVRPVSASPVRIQHHSNGELSPVVRSYIVLGMIVDERLSIRARNRLRPENLFLFP
jgi:hypothetical protein